MSSSPFSIREYVANKRSEQSWPFDLEDSHPLPPMAIQKFSWWADELKKVTKSKQRTPKKRSIVEIFAVTPPIEADKGKKMKRKKNKKIEICAEKKEKSEKPRSPINDPAHEGFSRKNSSIPIKSWKKSSCMKTLPSKRNFKLLCNSKLKISKSQKKAAKVNPVRTILKSSSRGVVRKTNKNPHKQGDTRTKSSNEVTKRVTFSGKDDILGHNDGCPSIDLPQFESLCKIFSRVLAASSALEKSQKDDNLPVASDVQVENVIATNAVTVGSEKKTGLSTERENSTEICSSAEGSSLALNVDLNCSLQTYTDMGPIIPEKSEVLSKNKDVGELTNLNSSISEASSSCSVVHAVQNLQRPSDACFLSASEKFISRSISRTEQTGKKPQLHVQPMPDYQANNNLSSRNFMGLASRPVPSCKEKHIGEDYVGLPLNSQGELIRSNSGANFSLSELFKQHNAGQSSIHSFPVFNETESTITVGCAAQGKFPPPIACFGVPNCPISKPHTYGFGSQRASERSYMPLDTNGLYHGYQEDNRTHNFIDMVKYQASSQPDMQQTVRLMGKNVIVGQNSKQQCHDDGRIWTDKEVITNDYHSVRVPNMPLQKQWQQHEWVPNPANGPPKGNSFWPLGTPGMQYRQLNRFPSTNRDPFNYPFSSQALLNKNSDSMFIKPRTAAVNTSYQMPVMTSNPSVTYQNMLRSSTHCKHSQGVSYGSSSNFQDPFQYRNNQTSSYCRPNFTEWLQVPRQQQKTNIGNPVTGSDFFARPPVSINPFFVHTPNNSQRWETMTRAGAPVAKDICGSKSKGRGRTQLNFTYLKNSDNAAGQSRKRTAPEDDIFIRPAKKPLPLSREDINFPNSGKTKEQRTRTIHTGDSRIGPIKLGAGSKHILRPNQDDTRQVHSTMPLSDTSSKFSDSQKTTRVFKF